MNDEETVLDAGTPDNSDPLALTQPDGSGGGLLDATMLNVHSDGGRPVGAMYGQVYALITKHCVGCHGANKPLDLSTAELARDQLVGVAAQYKACATDAGTPHVRVIAGAPGASLLMAKLEGRQSCGKQMPPDGTLAAEDTALFEAWIMAGAKVR